MREKIISYLKIHPNVVGLMWRVMRIILIGVGFFIPIRKKTMIFASFGGRKFDDSPKAIYDEVCKRTYFNDWRLIWFFVNPDEHYIPRGEKMKIDTLKFFYYLLASEVWVCNSSMDRGIELRRKNKNIIVETWHGTPLKMIGGDEKQNTIGGDYCIPKGMPDQNTIRCAQSDYDRNIFSRIFNADSNSFLLCDLPRNDELVNFDLNRIQSLKESFRIPINKKVILYMPTYREYLLDEDGNNYIAPPIDIGKWNEILGDDYCLLWRAHYAVAKSLDVSFDDFLIDVSNYKHLNDLYIMSDILISDYSSAFFDYSILNRPMFCFAYDYEEYVEKRGLYLDIEKELPCPIDKNEDELLFHISSIDYTKLKHNVENFKKKYVPNAGYASVRVVDEIVRRIEEKNNNR